MYLEITKNIGNKTFANFECLETTWPVSHKWWICFAYYFNSKVYIHTSSFGSQPCHKWSCKTCHPPTPTFCEAGRPQPRCTPHFSKKKEDINLMPDEKKNVLIKPSQHNLLAEKTSLIFARWVLTFEWKTFARYDLTENLLILKCDLLLLPFPVATLRAIFFLVKF